MTAASITRIPTVGTILLLAHPGLPLWPYLVCVALTGCSGANYAASMTNTNAFYPHRLKGFAVGFNAGAGNLGVPMIQLVGLLVIAVAGHRQPYGCAGFAEQRVGNCVLMHRKSARHTQFIWASQTQRRSPATVWR